MKAVILAGGIGSRLWPMSRNSKPKQFQKITGDKTMIQETCDRLSFLNPEDIFIATNKNFFEDILLQQLPDIPSNNIILEPALRDTATCIGFAAMKLSLIDPEDVMVVIYADHLVKDPNQFIEKLEVAEQIAKDGKTLNIIEVKARFPNVNLGYVHTGKKIEEINGNDVLEFKGFTEKPDIKKAKEFIKSGNYLWNTGMYVWRVDTILEKYKKHLPDTYKKLMKMKQAIGSANEEAIIRKEYSSCEKISIDYAIMEKVDPNEVRIIPANFGWSDVGTWESIHDELVKTPEENIFQAKQVSIDTKGSLIKAENPEKIIATIGLENIIVIDTTDALLICPKDRSQDVKKIVKLLRDKKEYL
ncbi:mannose-1-phosphate guanylyltransferase [bacterium]|nr:mannose-1-phosphate guanylyltransferase [bacterium]